MNPSNPKHQSFPKPTDPSKKYSSYLSLQRRCLNTNSYPYMQIKSKQAIYSAIINCNVHARELITSQICVKIMQDLTNMNDITGKMNFTVFYRANQMRDYARTRKGQCQRKNQNQVDLNRNFPTQFNFYNSSKTDEIYPGKSSIDQPFSICLNKLIQKKKPDFFLDIHSGQIATYYQQGINNEKQIQILKTINQTYPQLNISKITTLKQDDGQAINGHIFADLKVRVKVPYSLLYQVYTLDENKKAKYQCYDLFNPTTQVELIKCKNNWSKAIEKTIFLVIESLDQDHLKRNSF